MSRKKEVHNGKHNTNTVMSKVTTTHSRVVPGAARPVVEQSTALNSQHPMSAPATPDQRPHDKVNDLKVSTNGDAVRETSPRSLQSGTGHTPPTTKKLIRHCKFETGMAQAKRRVPYSMGPEKLDREPDEQSRAPGDDESSRLTASMKDLYQQLLPSVESEDRRIRFVNKLEILLQKQWPGSATKVHVFGSTGNCLGTRDSDVDICVTTDCKEIENVCLIAELLVSNGMQRIVCVSSAKIPIVKAWDPELQLSCDININNPIALENTHLIRSYIAIDDRVRPLAMIIKYWAKRRMLNDAALGGTLSSYTWICMVLSFLQTRTPPILPALQQKAGLRAVVLGGVNVAFDKDIEVYKGFGSRNKSSLGDLLCQFFRYYGHEFDYEQNALSLRLGRVISKSQKAWHLLQDNRLCVEEPFNTTRNLANTADDTSMRGIHMELRRAFKFTIKGDLAHCCEEFVPSPEERRQASTFVHATARPLIPQPPSQHPTHNSRSNRNSYRGSRSGRNSAARRASNPTTRNPNYLHDLPFQMTPQELQLQAQHQQHLLHDQLFQQYQFLQLQEQELRMQLYSQSFRQRGYMSAQTYPQPADLTARLSMSPTMYQNRFGGTSSYPQSTSPSAGVVTNPTSPALSNVNPDTRRLTRRTSLAASAAVISPRAHSQPARSMPIPLMFAQSQVVQEKVSIHQALNDRRLSTVSNSQRPPSPISAIPQRIRHPIRCRPETSRICRVLHWPITFPRSTISKCDHITNSISRRIGNSLRRPLSRLSSESSRMATGNSSPASRYASPASNFNMLGGETVPERSRSTEIRANLRHFDTSLPSTQRQKDQVPHGVVHESFPASASTSEGLGIDTPSTSEDQFQEVYEHPSIALAEYPRTHQTMAEGSDPIQPLDLRPPIYGHDLGGNAQLDTIRNQLLEEQEPQLFKPSSLATLSIHEQNNLIGSFDELDIRKKQQIAEKGSRNDRETHAALQGALSTRANGQDVQTNLGTASQKTGILSTWQPISKKKKKGRKVNRSENDVTMSNSAGGEMLPLDMSLRKGG